MIQKESQYARVLSKNDLLFMSLSATVGVGVFIIIGHVSKSCGNYSWLAMLCAGIFSLLTAFSYAELSSIFNSNSTEYEYIKFASNSEKIATFAGTIIIISELLILASIAIGLGYYCCDFLPCSPNLIAIGAILLFNYLNFKGIKLSAEFSKYALIIKLTIIILLIFLGLYNMKGTKFLIEKNKNVSDLVQASTFAIFSYVGFSAAINLTEEAKDPKDIPSVLITTTIITTILYIGITVALLIGLGSKRLGNSTTPLSDLSSVYFGHYGYIIFKALAIIALSDTLLMTSIMESRYIHSIIENYVPNFNKIDIHPTYKTPYISILVVVIITISFIILFKSISKTSIYGDIITICIFIIVNFIAIGLRFSDDVKRNYTMPLNIGKIPIPSVLGVIIGIFVIYNLCINKK